MDLMGRIGTRGLCTLALIATLAVSTWTLAPLRSAVADPLVIPAGGLAPSLHAEIFPTALEQAPVDLGAATAYAAGRALVGVAVLDRRTGTYVDNGASARGAMGTASVVKVLIAEELLHRHSVGQIGLGAAEFTRIEAMLVRSDDPAASSLYSQFGGVALIEATLRRHGLAESAPPADPQYWGNTKMSAHDVARFYANVLAGSVPAASRDYLFGLLRNVAPTASDGFGQHYGLAGVELGLDAAVKQGWMCCLDGVRQVHSTAVVGDDDRYVIVILTQYSPMLSWEHGQSTATEVARLVLAELAL